MPDNQSTTSFRADISQLKAAMQQAQRQVRLAESEFQKAAAGLDDWSSSAVGLSAKLKALNTTLDAQKKKADLARAEWEKAAHEFGENSAEAERAKIKLNQYEAQVAKTQKEVDKYTQELTDCENETGRFAKETDKAEKETKDASQGFTVMKGALADLVASGIKAAISGLKNLASASKEAYEEFDKGADSVIKATGATGAAAAELTESYNKVAHNVVGDMGEIGEAVGEVSTRFGLTGEELEKTSEQFLKFADITGTDAKDAVRLVSRAMENAGIDAKDYAKVLDMLAKAGQDTGVDVATLAESLTKTGAPMRQLGFSTEETIAMLAKFEKNGVNTETVLAGMKKAVANWGKEGKNAKEEYAKVLEEIRKTPDVAKASEIAIEAFGSKSGPELVDDIQAGKLEYKDFLDVLQKSEGTVTGTYEATQDGFDKIKLAIQGGKADLGAWVADIATEYQDEIVEFIDKVKEAIKAVIKWVIQNGPQIINVIKNVGKALAVVFVVKKVVDFGNAIKGVITMVKGFAAAMKGVEAASGLASSATGIFASLISPAGAVVLGITAVIAVTASLISIFKEEEREIEVLTDEQKKSVEESHRMKAAYDEMEGARRTAMGSVQKEFGYYQELLNEFDGIVGGNGKVKEGYEDRANFIMTTLNEALGLEMQMQDGIIQNYAKERQAIEQVMQSKKAEAILAANETAYADAIQHRTEAQQAYTAARQTFNDVLAKAEEYAVKVKEAELEYARIEREEGIEAAQDYMYTQQEVMDTYAKLQQEVTNTRAALSDATTAYQGYNQTIQNYEGLSAAIISGDAQKINDALLKTENGFKTANNTTADALRAQRDQFQRNYEALEKAMKDGDTTITQQMVNDAKELAKKAADEYEKSGKDTVAGYAKGLKDDQHYAEEAAKNLGYGSLAEFNAAMGIESPSKQTYASGEYFAQGFINGMGSKDSAIYQKAKQLAQTAIRGLKEGQKEGSPSKITTKSGKFFTEGFINGIGSMAPELIDTVKAIAREAIKALDSGAVVAGVRDSAAQLMQGAAVPLNFGNISGVRAAVNNPNRAAAIAGGRSTVNNNTYNLVQNNTSPKALTALETYQARRQQVAMLKAMM